MEGGSKDRKEGRRTLLETLNRTIRFLTSLCSFTVHHCPSLHMLLTPDFYHFYPLLLWFWFSDLTPSPGQEWVFLFQETECSPRGNAAPKDTWQCLELYSVVTCGVQHAIGICWVETRDTT